MQEGLYITQSCVQEREKNWDKSLKTLWQSLSGWICAFCKLSLFLQTSYLHAVSSFVIIIPLTHKQFLFFFTFFLSRQEIEMGLEAPGGSHTSFLFVHLSWCSSLNLWRHRENGGGIKKRDVAIYLHLFDSLKHESNIKNGSITQNLPGITESGCEFSLYHPSHSLGRVQAVSTPCVPVHGVSSLCFFLHKLSYPHILILPSEPKQWPIPCD